MTNDLSALLDQLDANAPMARRHLWLLQLLDWVRGDGSSAQAAVSRLQLLLDAVQAQPGLRQRLLGWWQVLRHTVDTTTLLADFGFASRAAFLSELGERLRLKILPGTPETTDAAELFMLALPRAVDAQWLALLDASTLARIAQLMGHQDEPAAAPDQIATPMAAPGVSSWQFALLEAITYCVSQIRAIGFSPELRSRMDATALESQPFHALAADADAVRHAFTQLLAAPADSPARDAATDALARAVQQLKDHLDACRMATNGVYAHLEAHGISVGLVFRLRQLRERVVRVRELMDCLFSPSPHASTARLLAKLVMLAQERSSLRALIASNATLLAAKMAERSAETGEHYITRTAGEYRQMLRQAAGGGVATAGTTLLKFAVMSAGLSAFWGGFWAGLLYAVSFVFIQLMHWTLATKQPAMTAPAMVAKLKDINSGPALDDFVDEVTHLVRSQVAAVLGNVGLVAPTVLLASWAWQAASLQPVLDTAQAAYVLQSLSLLNPGNLLFAAFTGVLLFSSSLIAGWAENWFVLHRLDSALRYNPRITAVLGDSRAGRWAEFMRRHVSGFAANISLGFMLGLIPPVLGFFGLGLEVRHVTLSMGQLAAAIASLGLQSLATAGVWWCLAAIPLIGVLNLLVSFWLAFHLALRARNLGGADRARIYVAILTRLRRHPRSFILPDKTVPAGPGHG